MRERMGEGCGKIELLLRNFEEDMNVSSKCFSGFELEPF